MSQIIASIDEVTPYLSICGLPGVTIDNIRAYTLIVDCMLEPNAPKMSNLDYCTVRIDDASYADIFAHFDRVTDRIHSHRQQKGRALVYCGAGVSRSASIVMAYLLRYGDMTLREAYYYLKAKRHIIHPNPGFWSQLIKFEHTIRGHNTVAMVMTAFGMVPDV